MRRVMFVCHGNICRSPMAEFVFLEMLKKRGARPIKVPNMVIRHASLKIRAEKAKKNSK